MNIVELKQNEVNVISGGGAAEVWSLVCGALGAAGTMAYYVWKSAGLVKVKTDGVEQLVHPGLRGTYGPAITLRNGAALVASMVITGAGYYLGHKIGEWLEGNKK